MVNLVTIAVALCQRGKRPRRRTPPPFLYKTAALKPLKPFRVKFLNIFIPSGFVMAVRDDKLSISVWLFRETTGIWKL